MMAMSTSGQQVHDILQRTQDQSSEIKQEMARYLFGALVVSRDPELTDLYWNLKDSPKYCDEANELTYHILIKSRCAYTCFSKLEPFLSKTPTLPPALALRGLVADVVYNIRDESNARRLIESIARFQLNMNPSTFHTQNDGNQKGLLQLFIKAEQQQCITPENVSVLEECLKKMKRKDLLSLVDKYKSTTRSGQSVQESEPLSIPDPKVRSLSNSGSHQSTPPTGEIGHDPQAAHKLPTQASTEEEPSDGKQSLVLSKQTGEIGHVQHVTDQSKILLKMSSKGSREEEHALSGEPSTIVLPNQKELF